MVAGGRRHNVHHGPSRASKKSSRTKNREIGPNLTNGIRSEVQTPCATVPSTIIWYCSCYSNLRYLCPSKMMLGLFSRARTLPTTSVGATARCANNIFSPISPLFLRWQSIRHATKKAGGSSNNGRDSAGRRLGIKVWPGTLAKAGSIIIRQRGKKFLVGDNVGMGNDHTIFALIPGRVRMERSEKNRKRNFVHVIAEEP